MPYILLPLTKSPWPRGRIGPPQMQDWYGSLNTCLSLLKKYEPSKILILSSFQAAGELSEIEWYQWALEDLSIPSEDVLYISQAKETSEQIEIASSLAKEQDAELIIISTFLHYPRAQWLCRGKGFRHCVGWGIPRPKEALTDIVLTFVFPVLDLLGQKEWFKNKVATRRGRGKH
ncbi:YdcF family protein [Patescibacteria group bacterium]|nr:YdcF family protein [Patescibacteria group bacterium]